MTGIDIAIERAGDRATLASKLGVTVQAVCQWVKRGWVPAGRALEIEALYGIPRADLFKPQLAAYFADAPTI